MNRYVKPILILLGLVLISHAIIFPVRNIDAGASAQETTLRNYARLGQYDEMSAFFSSILHRTRSGWPLVLILGVGVVIVAGCIKTGSKDGKP